MPCRYSSSTSKWLLKYYHVTVFLLVQAISLNQIIYVFLEILRGLLSKQSSNNRCISIGAKTFVY